MRSWFILTVSGSSDAVGPAAAERGCWRHGAAAGASHLLLWGSERGRSPTVGHGCCSGEGTDAALLWGGSRDEKRLPQGLGLRGDVMDTDLGFSHEKVLRSLQFGGGIGVLSH